MDKCKIKYPHNSDCEKCYPVTREERKNNYISYVLSKAKGSVDSARLRNKIIKEAEEKWEKANK